MLQDLKTLVEVESPTDDLAACIKVVNTANEITQRLIGSKSEILDEKGRPQGAKLKGDASGTPVMIGGVEKMSKSKNNGVDPQALIDQYGADTARLFVMFAAPPEQQLEWSGAGVDGASRFLRRVWTYSSSRAESVREAQDAVPSNLNDAEKELRREVYSILKQANFDYQRRQYNTVVSAAMKMLNVLEPIKLGQDCAISAPVLRECLSILLRVLYPVVPHLTHVLWKDLGYANVFGSLLDAPWPSVDESALVQTEITLMLQINGKLRGDIKVPADASKEQIEALALQSEPASKALNGGAPKKVIVVPGRLVNIVA